MAKDSLHINLKMIDLQDFEAQALRVFQYQYENNSIYRKWCKSLQKTSEEVKTLDDVPYLPISFFKSYDVMSGNWKPELTFESSGTTANQTSKHHVDAIGDYHENCKTAFETNYGELSDYVILALLPSYLERNNSGLVHMVNHFIEGSQSPDSGFFLNDLKALHEKLYELRGSSRKVMLWGVTFALLDFAEAYPIAFEQLRVMVTGGMKGRRKEMVRQEVHERLKSGLGTSLIYSEYGMTELFSQAYADVDGFFCPSKTMQVRIRDFNDPFTFAKEGRAGGINVIDLANWKTCSFIETQDIGKMHDKHRFEVLGRYDHADLRGCNLMVM